MSGRRRTALVAVAVIEQGRRSRQVGLPAGPHSALDVGWTARSGRTARRITVLPAIPLRAFHGKRWTGRASGTTTGRMASVPENPGPFVGRVVARQVQPQMRTGDCAQWPRARLGSTQWTFDQAGVMGLVESGVVVVDGSMMIALAPGRRDIVRQGRGPWSALMLHSCEGSKVSPTPLSE